MCLNTNKRGVLNAAITPPLRTQEMPAQITQATINFTQRLERAM
jgi:hypothetical protein